MKKIEQKKWSESTPQEKRKGCAASFIFAAVIIGFFWFVSVMEDDQQNSYYNDITTSAQVYADDLLVQQLKYPDGWEYERKQIDRLDSVTYKLTAVVLAKNGFGVRGRMIYNIKLEFIGSKKDSYSSPQNPGNWHILSNELVQ